MKRAGIIDYERGNLRSVQKALERVGFAVELLECPVAAGCGPDALILPGVGSFGDAMENLRRKGFEPMIRDWIESDRPFLGICLGYQLLFSGSEESPGARGLGLLEGRVVRFPDTVERIPHMGWNVVRFSRGYAEEVFKEPEPSFFYHVHSYYPDGVEEHLACARTEYDGVRFASGISSGNVHAFQFHPEKSQDAGLRLLRGFFETVPG